MPDLQIHRLLDTGVVKVSDVRCQGTCRDRSAERCARATHLVFPYRGVYLRHVGGEKVVADGNHVLFFNAGEVYTVSHPLAGGNDSLVLTVSAPRLRELAAQTLLTNRDELRFRSQSLRIDPRAQALVALLRQSLRQGSIEPLEAECIALTLVCRSLGPRTAHETQATPSRRRLVDRAKLVMASNLTRRWSLAEIAAEVGGSAVYLTQVFQQVEGLSLYRYQLQLRLAHSLELISRYDDISSLAMDLGFSSHSHFGAAFKKLYGRSPIAFKNSSAGSFRRTSVRPKYESRLKRC